MLSEKIISMTNNQIKKEFESAYLYLQIANYYESKGLNGFANWFKIQSTEEESHAMKFYQYLHDNEADVVLQSIDFPKKNYSDFEEPLEDSLIHEQEITEDINKIFGQAMSENDYRTKNFLEWFVQEQLEEEVTANALLDKIQLFGKTPGSLYLLDRELGKRKPVMEA